MLYSFSNVGSNLIKDKRLENKLNKLISHHTLNALTQFQMEISELLGGDDMKNTGQQEFLATMSDPLPQSCESTALCEHKDKALNDYFPESRPSFTLTERQAEILHWLKVGKSNVEISIILSISPDTVKFHLRNVYSILGVFNRVQAAQAEVH